MLSPTSSTCSPQQLRVPGQTLLLPPTPPPSSLRATLTLLFCCRAFIMLIFFRGHCKDLLKWLRRGIRKGSLVAYRIVLGSGRGAWQGAAPCGVCVICASIKMSFNAQLVALLVRCPAWHNCHCFLFSQIKTTNCRQKINKKNYCCKQAQKNRWKQVA